MKKACIKYSFNFLISWMIAFTEIIGFLAILEWGSLAVKSNESNLVMFRWKLNLVYKNLVLATYHSKSSTYCIALKKTFFFKL